MGILYLALLFLAAAFADEPPRAFDIKQFGATGDGKTLDSPAINKAIDAASAAGGGAVYVPAGTFLSGSIRLKSNITLYLDQGAVILATDDPTAYDPAEPNQWDKFQDYGHSHFHNSLIWGENLENIAIDPPECRCIHTRFALGASVFANKIPRRTSDGALAVSDA